MHPVCVLRKKALSRREYAAAQKLPLPAVSMTGKDQIYHPVSEHRLSHAPVLRMMAQQDPVPRLPLKIIEPRAFSRILQYIPRPFMIRISFISRLTVFPVVPLTESPVADRLGRSQTPDQDPVLMS